MCSYGSFILVVVLLPPFFAMASSLSFEFSGQGRNQDCPRGINTVCLQGDAFINDQGVIHLTASQVDRSLNLSVGRAVFSEPVRLYDISSGEVANFSSDFTFTIDNLGRSSYGDGLAFFLGHYPSSIPLNSTGRCLGLMTDSADKDKVPVVSSPNETFVAVEFDSFKNFFDFSSRHVGIDINTIASSSYFNLSIHFEGNYTGNARISYDGANKNLSVSVDYAGVHYHMAHEVNLTANLPEFVSVGFSATTGQQFELHKIHTWKFTSTLEAGDPQTTSPPPSVAAGGPQSISPERGKNNEIGLALGIVGAVGGTIFLVLICFLVAKRRTNPRSREENAEEEESDPTMDEELEGGRGPQKVRYEELLGATDGFDVGRRLGAGGFGAVYRGELNDVPVAIKVSRDAERGKKEFMTEVKVISQLRHRNLVELVGWSHFRGKFLLVYEFMPNGSLDMHLFGDSRPPLTWSSRQGIVLGLASALSYLHEGCTTCVLHRDVKSSNIMLDSAFNAKLGDFGLARLVHHGAALHTTALAGTISYMAPECFVTRKASKQSDVYSFGLVLLEIACGRRAMEDDVVETLLESVWKLHGRGSLLNAVDPKLEGEFEKEEAELVLLVGLWCAQPDPALRPPMGRVVGVLNREALLPYLPPSMPTGTYGALEAAAAAASSREASCSVSGTSALNGSSSSTVPSSNSIRTKFYTTAVSVERAMDGPEDGESEIHEIK